VKIEWVILAEGLGQDAKGALTIIGLNQNVLATPTLPAPTKRAVVSHVVAEQGEVKAGDSLSLRFNVISPSGKVIAANTVQGAIGPFPWPELPLFLDFPAELVISFNEYGTHRFEVTAQIGEADESVGHAEFYVLDATAPQEGERSPQRQTNPRAAGSTVEAAGEGENA
jgi:hypothetical protein